LKAKGVRFVPQYYAGSVKAFVIIPRDNVPSFQGAEAYDLLDGDRMLVVEAEGMDQLEDRMQKIPIKKAYYVATRKIGEKVVKAELICDYCGGKINGQPLVFKRGRRTYYACCNGCLRGLKKKLSS